MSANAIPTIKNGRQLSIEPASYPYLVKFRKPINNMDIKKMMMAV